MSPRAPVFGRLFLVLTGLLFVFVVAAVREPVLYRLWNLPLNGLAAHYFVDARGVLGGADTLRENGGRFSWDQLAARGDLYNYPRVWSYAGWIGLGDGQRLAVGVTFAALFLVAQYRLLRPKDGWALGVAGLVLFSPAGLLLMERGNNDAPVFALVVAATAAFAGLRAVRWGVGGGLLLAAACLKLYPLAAIAALPVRRGWRTAVGVGTLLGLFAVYAYAVREDFARISARTPRAYHGSYGGLVVTSFVRESLELRVLLAKFGVDMSSPERRARVEGIVRAASYTLMLGLGGGAMAAGVRSARRVRDTVSTELDRVRFRAGAAIYGGTFLIGNNWDYRLVFLGLTVPLLDGWRRGGELALRRWARAVLALTVVCLWAFAAPRTALTFGLIQVATWTLFLALAFLFGLLLAAGLGAARGTHPGAPEGANPNPS